MPAGLFPSWLTQVWGYIEGAVEQRATTSELYERIREGFTELRIEPGPISIQDVNQLRHYAVEIRETMNTAADAVRLYRETGFDQAVTGDMIAAPWWGRDVTTRLTSPQYMVRAEIEVTNPLWRAGEPGQPETITEWVTLKPERAPQSIADLDAQVNALVGKKGASPKRDFAGVANYQIMEL